MISPHFYQNTFHQVSLILFNSKTPSQQIPKVLTDGDKAKDLLLYFKHRLNKDYAFNSSCTLPIFSTLQTDATVFSTSSSMFSQTNLCFLLLKSSSIAFKLFAAVKSTESIFEQSITTGVVESYESIGQTMCDDIVQPYLPLTLQPC